MKVDKSANFGGYLSAVSPKQAVRPMHIVCGLGGAERELIATWLALFDESSLGAYLDRLYTSVKDRVSKLSDSEIEEVADEVRDRQQQWVNSSLSDEHLRLALWMQLRSALQLAPKLSGSYCGSERLADDISASVVNFLSPPENIIGTLGGWIDGITNRGKTEEDNPVNLHSVVEPVLRELLEAALAGENGEAGDGILKESVEQAILAMEGLSLEEREQIKDSLGVDDISAAALTKIIAAGGGLTLFSSAVSMAGFSAYILAAQTSAFIPLISGPGLVSFVSVLSNPITVVAGAVGAGWWLKKSASQKIKAAVATRIVAMLAVQGMGSGQSGIRSAIAAFSSASTLPEHDSLPSELIASYREEWGLIETQESPVYEWSGQDWQAFEKPLSEPAQSDRGDIETHNTAAMDVMMVGDMLYHAAQISPHVMAAADFAYLAGVEGPISFALLANDMSFGAVVRLKGYVAEQVVAAKLQAAGYVVGLPESASEPGWDLLVDGQKVQVKFDSDLSGIREHFAVYDYPIIANTELMDRIPEEFVDRVHFIDGVSNELITDITEMSVAAGQSMTDADVASMAFAITAFRSAKGLYQGELTGAQAVEQVVMDGTVRVGLAVTGAWAGAGVGLLLFGPAGAWILGAGVPVLAQSQTGKVVDALGERVKSSQRKDWEEGAHKSLDTLQRVGARALRSRMGQLDKLISDIGQGFAQEYIVYRAHDQRLFARECIRRKSIIGRATVPQPEQRFSVTLRWLTSSEVHPMVYQLQLKEVVKCMQSRPGLIESMWSKE